MQRSGGYSGLGLAVFIWSVCAASMTVAGDGTAVASTRTITEITGFANKGNATLDGAHLYDTEWGYILAANPKDAATAAQEMRMAAAALYHYFGEVAGRGLIFDIRYRNAIQNLPLDGIMWRLPWKFDWHAALERSPSLSDAALRAQVSNQLAAAGIRKNGPALEALVQKLKTRLNEAHVADSGKRKSETALPAADNPGQGFASKPLRHEIGHVLFAKQVYGQEGGAGYGSSAPDWLDETAAVLMEGQDLTAKRRARFRDMVQEGRLYTLSHYLHMSHPVRSMDFFKDVLKDAKTKGSMVRTFKLTPANQQKLQALVDFYGFTRGFIDYLMARGHDPRIFRHLARAMAEGMTAEEWFQLHGVAYGLPSSMEKLEADFQAYATGEALQGKRD